MDGGGEGMPDMATMQNMMQQMGLGGGLGGGWEQGQVGSNTYVFIRILA